MDNKEINEIAVRNLNRELRLIADGHIRIFTTDAIHAAPGRYWIKPSGNHPGHHPHDEHGDWGNLIHVKRTIIIAELLTEAEDVNSMYKDIICSGLTIHDLGKYGVDGLDESINKGHPLLVREVVKNIAPCPLMGLIMRVAETHMGRWGLKPPEAMYEKMGHHADYIASRCNIHIPVEIEI